MGRGEESQGVRGNVKVLSDTLEAVIGAIWKDSHDYNVLKELVVRLWTPLGLLPSVTYEEIIDVIQKCVLFKPQNVELYIEKLELLLSCADKETVNGLLVDPSITIDTKVLSLILSKKPDQEYLDAALIYFILSGSEEDVALLLHHGSNPNTVYDPDLELKGEGGGFEWFSYHRYHSLSALQIAVIGNNVSIVILLVKHGGDPNWNQGITIEKVRPEKNKEEAALKCKKLACQSIRDTVEVALSDYGDELIDGVTSDISCAFFGESTSEMTLLECIEKKRQQKPPTFNRCQNLQTALHIAFLDLDNNPPIELIQLLLDKGANPNAQDYEENTPLHILVSDEHASYFMKIINLLFDRGVDPNLKNFEGKTVLHTAASCVFPSIEVIGLLIDRGVNPDLKDSKDRTVTDLLTHKIHLIPNTAATVRCNQAQENKAAAVAAAASPISFWHFRCKNHNGASFLGKSRVNREAAEQALKRHQERKHGGLIEGAVEPTAENHPKMLCQ
jgi:ankyrin repeat protein